MIRIKQKLKDTKGETLAEILIASLLAAIALLILATMIRTSHTIINNSNAQVDTFYEEVNQIETRSIEDYQDTKLTITYYKGMQDNNSIKAEIPIRIYKTKNYGLTLYTSR